MYPMPAILVGANVDDKPNFMTVAWCGVADSKPPTVCVSIQFNRHTFKGMKQNMTFSINIPSTDLVKETDFCGLKHGSQVNKIEACQFKIFYGKLNNAPLIEQCPINLECKIMHILDVGTHALTVGKVEGTYISDNCLTDDKPDINKINPFTFISTPALQYRKLGDILAEAYSIGKELDEEQ